MSNNLFDWELTKGIIGNLLAAWLFILLVKTFAIGVIYKFFGKYYHHPLGRANDYDSVFIVSYSLKHFFQPITTIVINIRRESTLDGSDWKGEYISDILNPYYFKGTYKIKDITAQDKDGWHELHLLKNTKEGKTKIAVNIHYFDDNTGAWNNDGGYYLEKHG